MKIKYNAIILAAGLSSRAGGFKPLFKFGKSTLIECAISPFIEKCGRIVVVTGYRGCDVREVVEKYKNVQVVYNENHLDGMFSSVKCGLRNADGDRIFITPGDYPFIDGSICNKLMEAEGEIRIPSFNKRRGHPVLISDEIAREIIQCSDESLRDFFNRKEITYVDVPKNDILLDIDTNEDYLMALKRGRNERG